MAKWQSIPNQILQQEERKKKADSWLSQQRQWMADDWREKQLELLELDYPRNPTQPEPDYGEYATQAEELRRPLQQGLGEYSTQAEELMRPQSLITRTPERLLPGGLEQTPGYQPAYRAVPGEERPKFQEYLKPGTMIEPSSELLAEWETLPPHERELAERQFQIVGSTAEAGIFGWGSVVSRGAKALASAAQSVAPAARPIDQVITMAKEVARQTEPSSLTKGMAKIPGVKQVMEAESPRIKMVGEAGPVRESLLAEKMAKVRVSMEALPERHFVLKELKEVFGKDVVRGKAETPYILTAKQKTALDHMDAHNQNILQKVKTGYDADIGEFVIQPQPPRGGTGSLLDVAQANGYYLPNVDVSEDALHTLSSKQRTFATAQERRLADPTFTPELDVEVLLSGLDWMKASAASRNTLLKTLPGKTRLEVMEILKPELYKKMTEHRKELAGLQSSLKTLDTNLYDAINTFLRSPTDVDDITDLVSSLDVTLKSGPRRGLDIGRVRQEIDRVRRAINELKPEWASTNTKPYALVKEDVYRYFPAKVAKIVKESRKEANNSFLTFIEDVRGQAFSGDLSPFGVQNVLGIFADPIGSVKTAMGGIKKSIQTGKPMRAMSMEALMEELSNPNSGWLEYATLRGREPISVPKEFAAGFLSKIPGFRKFNDSVYITVTRSSKALYDRSWQHLVDSGLPELEAKVAAVLTADQIFPTSNPAIYGQSAARAQLLRALPTSYSFIRKPAEMMTQALTGYAKLATFQPLTPVERLSVRLMTTFAASTLATSATSAAISAGAAGKDVPQAVWDAINPDPNNKKFASLIIGEQRIPLGGPYRSLFRAIFPKQVEGIPVPVPFGGMLDFAYNRINPFIRTQLDLFRNRDFYGRPIHEGEFAERLVRILAYELEGSIPLTAGSVVEGVRTGQSPEEIAGQSISQFMGTNVLQNPLPGATTGGGSQRQNIRPRGASGPGRVIERPRRR